MNVNYLIRKMKMEINDVINQMQNQFLINVKPVLNQLMVLKILFYHFKSFLFILKGTAINGNEENLPASSTTVTKIAKITESTVILPVKTETTENGPSDEIKTSAEEIVSTTTKEEVTETTTVVVQSAPSATTPDEKVPIEALTDGMDTSE